MNLKCLFKHSYRLLERYPLSLVDIEICTRCQNRKVKYGKLPSGCHVSYQAVDSNGW